LLQGARRDEYSEKNQTRKYVRIDSKNITPADHGLSSINGTTYPGMTSPDNTQPSLRLKKQTTNIPTQTTGMIELARLLAGKIESGKKSKITRDLK
jgi:hypothetical protein